MTDEDALLAAIAANPDDDTVRLAYADWLDERGDEASAARAEYIRIQIRRQQWPTEATDSARESWLYLTYFDRWRRDIPGFEIAMDQRRGFPCRAAAAASAVLAAADNPLARIFDEFTVLLDGAASWRPVLQRGLMAGVRDLIVRFAADVTWPGWDTRFFAGHDFPRVELLRLDGLGLGDADAGWLCAATGFPRLRELDLRNNAVSEYMADSLTVAPITRKLKRLRLAGNRIGPGGVRKLAARFGPAVDLA